LQKVLIISDPLAKFNPYSDSTYLLFLTAEDYGLNIYTCAPGDIYSVNNHVAANCQPINIAHGLAKIHSTLNWFSVIEPPQQINLLEFAYVFVRNDPPFNLEYYYLTQLLSVAEEAGARIVNSPCALRNYNEKLSILNFPHLIAPTLVSKNKDVIDKFIQTQGTCVVKPLDLMGGRGVFQLSATELNYAAILETVSNYFTQNIMVQRFIPEVAAGDKRIFIINGVVIKHCLYRIPQTGQIRGNLAAGGRGEVHPLTVDDYKLANQVAQWLNSQGIAIAGIDVIGNYLTEINITSPTGAQQIYQHSGINVFAALFADPSNSPSPLINCITKG
jgi:glutathione synthase